MRVFIKLRSALCLGALMGLLSCSHGTKGGDDPAPNPLDAIPTVNYTPALKADTATYRAQQMALAKAMAIVRYYHPSEEAAHTNWDTFATAAMMAIEGARNSSEFATVLRGLFHPIAPTISINGVRALAPVEGAQVVAWQHIGASIDQALDDWYSPGTAPFSSARVFAKANAAQPEFPTQNTFHYEIGAGITLDVPMILGAENGKATPQGRAPFLPDAKFPLQADNVYARYGAVALLYGAIAHFHPYYLVDVPTNMDAFLKDGLNWSAPAQDVSAFAWTLRKVVAKLRDGHTFVDWATEPNDNHLPVALEYYENKVVVTWVSLSLDAAGLQAGDVLLSRDGQPLEAVLGDLTPYVPLEESKRLIYATRVFLSYGPPNQTHTYTVEKVDGSHQNISLGFTESVPQYGAERLASSGPALSELEPGIFYVNVARPADVAGLVPKLLGAKAIIFDARMEFSEAATGGTKSLVRYFSAQDVLSPQMRTGHYREPFQQHMTDQDDSWTQPPMTPTLTARKFVLMNRHTQSAGETQLGKIQYTHAATLIGEPSHGANGNINEIRLLWGTGNSQFMVTFTGINTRNRDGSRLQAVGIVPEVLQSHTIVGIRAGTDEVLDRAMALARLP